MRETDVTWGTKFINPCKAHSGSLVENYREGNNHCKKSDPEHNYALRISWDILPWDTLLTWGKTVTEGGPEMLQRGPGPFIPIQQSRVGAVLMYFRGNCHQSCMGRRVTCMQDLWGKKGKRTSVLQGPLVPYQPQQGKMQRSPSRLKFENKYTAKVVREQKKKALKNEIKV